jgi:hypothetical protein
MPSQVIKEERSSANLVICHCYVSAGTSRSSNSQVLLPRPIGYRWKLSNVFGRGQCLNPILGSTSIRLIVILVVDLCRSRGRPSRSLRVPCLLCQVQRSLPIPLLFTRLGQSRVDIKERLGCSLTALFPPYAEKESWNSYSPTTLSIAPFVTKVESVIYRTNRCDTDPIELDSTRSLVNVPSRTRTSVLSSRPT